jgi:hypothetical protein
MILVIGITMRNWPRAGGRYSKLKRAYNTGVHWSQDKFKYRPKKRSHKIHERNFILKKKGGMNFTE